MKWLKILNRYYMATYILKRKTYSINPYKVTLSDISLEFGIEFPEEMKRLAKMERRIEAKLHYWAMSSPGINMVAPPELIYQSLNSGENVIPALVNSLGEVSLEYDTSSRQYKYGETLLEDSNAFVNIVIDDLNKVISTNLAMTESPDMKGGEIEALKQNIIYYQTYLDNVCMAFGIPTPAEQEAALAQQEDSAQQ